MAAARVTPPVPACDRYPRRVPGVEVHRRADDGAIVLRGGWRYVQVSARALEIWDALDGIANLRELAVRFSETGAGGDVGSALVKLVRTLAQSGMITLEPPGSAAPAAARDPAITRRGALEGYLSFPLRPAVDAAYRLVCWAFHPAIVALAAVIDCRMCPVVSVQRISAGLANLASGAIQFDNPTLPGIAARCHMRTFKTNPFARLARRSRESDEDCSRPWPRSRRG